MSDSGFGNSGIKSGSVFVVFAVGSFDYCTRSGGVAFGSSACGSEFEDDRFRDRSRCEENPRIPSPTYLLKSKSTVFRVLRSFEFSGSGGL